MIVSKCLLLHQPRLQCLLQMPDFQKRDKKPGQKSNEQTKTIQQESMAYSKEQNKSPETNHSDIKSLDLFDKQLIFSALLRLFGI